MCQKGKYVVWLFGGYIVFRNLFNARKANEIPKPSVLVSVLITPEIGGSGEGFFSAFEIKSLYVIVSTAQEKIKKCFVTRCGNRISLA
jgi:hypothetical protein